MVPIVEVRPEDLAPAELESIHAVDVAIEAEARVPDLLVPPLAHVATDWLHPLPYEHTRLFLAETRGELGGYAWCGWEDLPSNRKTAKAEVQVRPGRRDGDTGRQLLGSVVRAARDFGCGQLLVEARAEGPEAEFLGWHGLEAKLTSPRNVLWMRGLDSALMHEWVQRAHTRAREYSLIAWTGATSDELVGDLSDLWHVMNTAPLEDLDWEPEVMTPDRWRALEANWTARSMTPFTAMVVHEPTGVPVGFTQLVVDGHWRQVAVQEDTGVQPEHRNRGLGRWLKAANVLRLVETHPEVEAVTTWNAGSNAPMLRINHEMGFSALESWAEWQADLEQVERALGS